MWNLYQLFTHLGLVIIEVFYFWAQMLILLCSSQNLISYSDYSYIITHTHTHTHTHTLTLLRIKVYFPFQEIINTVYKSERRRMKYASVAVNRTKREKWVIGVIIHHSCWKELFVTWIFNLQSLDINQPSSVKDLSYLPVCYSNSFLYERKL
jgi:hypothetical protein